MSCQVCVCVCECVVFLFWFALCVCVCCVCVLCVCCVWCSCSELSVGLYENKHRRNRVTLGCGGESEWRKERRRSVPSADNLTTDVLCIVRSTLDTT